jgi:hypothetical protein
MQKEFVIAKCDVYCRWTGPFPRYRCYVNDELFSERTWIWNDVYLEENLQIQAVPGRYTVRVELLDIEHASIKVRNLRVDTGPGVIGSDGALHIYVPENVNEST